MRLVPIRCSGRHYQQASSAQALVQQHTGDARWGAHAQRIASGEMWHPPRPGGNNDQAHPPIHPTRYTQGEGNWSQEKARTCMESSLLRLALIASMYRIVLRLHYVNGHANRQTRTVYPSYCSKEWLH